MWTKQADKYEHLGVEAHPAAACRQELDPGKISDKFEQHRLQSVNDPGLKHTLPPSDARNWTWYDKHRKRTVRKCGHCRAERMLIVNSEGGGGSCEAGVRARTRSGYGQVGGSV